MSSLETLFKPIKVGQLELSHRGVMAPLTRFRSSREYVQQPIAIDYYRQRASREGTLVITEAVFITKRAGGYQNVPGIWNQEQIDAWSKVITEVHAQKSFVFVQLWALGRAASKKFIESEGCDYVSASNIARANKQAPRPLTKQEIKEYARDYATAAKNAIAAGADGVEIHGANGYLLDQFLHENSNDRTDEYGGSIENRARFMLEVVDAVSAAIGADRVGLRLSPWGDYNDVHPGVSPIPQFSFVVAELERRAMENESSRIAYIHTVEPRVVLGAVDVDDPVGSNQFIRDIWNGPWIRAGGLSKDLEYTGNMLREDGNALAAFGRHFISNPDMIDRLEKGIALTKYNRKTFYTPGTVGYTDYPVAGEENSKSAKL